MAENALQWRHSDFTKLKRQLTRASGDMITLGPKIGNVIVRHIRRQFATRGAHFGTPWKPLKPQTLLYKRRHGYPASPLVRSGKMKAGVTKVPLDIQWYTNTSGDYGTAARIAWFQHHGTKRHGRVVIPARPILKVTREMADDVAAEVRKQVRGKLK